jgi:hypothetical protein
MLTISVSVLPMLTTCTLVAVSALGVLQAYDRVKLLAKSTPGVIVINDSLALISERDPVMVNTFVELLNDTVPPEPETVIVLIALVVLGVIV